MTALLARSCSAPTWDHGPRLDRQRHARSQMKCAIEAAMENRLESASSASRALLLLQPMTLVFELRSRAPVQ